MRALWILLLVLFSLMVVLSYRNDCLLLSVLQFVPRNVDIGFCTFSQRIERGLTMAFLEVNKHQEFYNFTVQVRGWTCFASIPFPPSPLLVLCFIQTVKWVWCSLAIVCSLGNVELLRLCHEVSWVFSPVKQCGTHIQAFISFMKKWSKVMIYIQKHYWIW